MVANLTYFLEQNNYGQRLQCFALQRYIESAFGQKVLTLDSNARRRNVDFDDGRYFHRFEKECMNLLRPAKWGNDILANCDSIVIGGDQVLNTDWNISETDLFPYVWGRSVPRRNAFFYGAGVSNSRVVKHAVIQRLRPHLVAYGLREDCRNIQDYFKTIDPVFLVYDKWGDYATGTEQVKGELSYIVDGGCASEISITVGSCKRLYLVNGRGKGIAPDPRDFIGLFRNATSFRTNSFHGFSLALMFRIERIKVLNIHDHRIQNLISMLGVRFDGDRVVNYDEIFRNIRSEVAKAHDFIGMCLAASPKDLFAYTKDAAVRGKSTSGGFCAEAARHVFSNGGAVYGGAFTDDFKGVAATRTETMEEYFCRLSKSKYSFCRLPNLPALKQEVEKGIPLLYIGSPCQIRAIRKFLGKEYDNLVLVDFRCRGFSSPRKLAAFVDGIAKKEGRKVVGIDFRPNHRSGAITVSLEGGKSLSFGKNVWDDFVFGSLPMCSRCVFAHGTVSCADLTVGDAWDNMGNRLRLGADFTPERGCNIVSVNTPKGQRLLDAISPHLNIAFRR